ncbi:MAG: hypothetical protein Q8O65_05465 [Nitrosopumilaceae archaeon]|nr:hypothetical protein [Nitrosopumilaceae archaeon]
MPHEDRHTLILISESIVMQTSTEEYIQTPVSTIVELNKLIKIINSTTQLYDELLITKTEMIE